MADNVAITAGSGTTIATDDVGGGVQLQRAKSTWGPDGSFNDTDTASGKALPVQIRNSTGTELGNATTPWVVGGWTATVTSSVTRPNDTTAYAANDAWANATSSPATLTFTGCFRASGKSSLLTDMVVTSSANQSTLMQGELWLFDTAPTAINDNAAFTITDSEYNTVVAKIPFSIDSVGTVTSGAGGNAGCFVTGLNALLTGVSSANLTGLIKVINAYTPVANEVLTFRLKLIGID